MIKKITKKQNIIIPILNTSNLKDFILSLKINPEQEKYLLDELPTMNEKERIELLETLNNIYILNEEKDRAIEKIKDNWE